MISCHVIMRYTATALQYRMRTKCINLIFSPTVKQSEAHPRLTVDAVYIVHEPLNSILWTGVWVASHLN